MKGSRTPRDLADDLIVKVITRRGPSTRSELVRQAGLTKTTIADHVRSLLERGVLLEVDQKVGSRGRPARLLDLSGTSGTSGCVAVVVLTHGKTLVGGPIQCMAASVDGLTRRFATVQPGASPIASAAGAVRSLLVENLDLGALQGCVLGVPLPMFGDPVSGSDRRAARVIPPLGHLIGAQPQVELSGALGVPTWAANDTDLAALGEACYGAGRGSVDVAFVRVIAGLGMGIARGGSLPGRVRDPAGEIAHIRVGTPGHGMCICGAPGCWYTTSKDGLSLASHVSVRGRTCSSLEELLEAVAEQDRDVVRRVRQLGRRIGHAMGSFYALTRPSPILLEAELGPAFGPLSAGIADTLRSQTPDWGSRPPIITRGQLAHQADLLGGVRLLRMLLPGAGGRP
jgi:predicted NBD/HSP70 family sugar kinase